MKHKFKNFEELYSSNEKQLENERLENAFNYLNMRFAEGIKQSRPSFDFIDFIKSIGHLQFPIEIIKAEYKTMDDLYCTCKSNNGITAKIHCILSTSIYGSEITLQKGGISAYRTYCRNDSILDQIITVDIDSLAEDYSYMDELNAKTDCNTEYRFVIKGTVFSFLKKRGQSWGKYHPMLIVKGLMEGKYQTVTAKEIFEEFGSPEIRIFKIIEGNEILKSSFVEAEECKGSPVEISETFSNGCTLRVYSYWGKLALMKCWEYYRDGDFKLQFKWEDNNEFGQDVETHALETSKRKVVVEIPQAKLNDFLNLPSDIYTPLKEKLNDFLNQIPPSNYDEVPEHEGGGTVWQFDDQ